jgi:hypothetical protein
MVNCSLTQPALPGQSNDKELSHKLGKCSSIFVSAHTALPLWVILRQYRLTNESILLAGPMKKFMGQWWRNIADMSMNFAQEWGFKQLTCS